MARLTKQCWSDPPLQAFWIAFVLLLAVRLIIVIVDYSTERVFDKELAEWQGATNRVAQKYERDVLDVESEYKSQVDHLTGQYQTALKREEVMRKLRERVSQGHVGGDVEESEEGRFVADLYTLFRDASSIEDRQTAFRRLEQPELYGEEIKTGFYVNGDLDPLFVERLLSSDKSAEEGLIISEPVLPEYVAPSEPVYPVHPEGLEPDYTWLGKMGFFSLKFFFLLWFVVSWVAYGIYLLSGDIDFRITESAQEDEDEEDRDQYRVLQSMYLPIVLPARLMVLCYPVVKELVLLPFAGFRKVRHQLFVWKFFMRRKSVRSHLYFKQMQELRGLLTKAQSELKSTQEETLRSQLRSSIHGLETSIGELEKADTLIDPESIDAREQMGRVAVLRGKIDSAISEARINLNAQKEVESVRTR